MSKSRAALIMALHKCTQQNLPVLLIGAGLPQLVGQAGRAKSYAERLFEYPESAVYGLILEVKDVFEEKLGCIRISGIFVNDIFKTHSCPDEIRALLPHC